MRAAREVASTSSTRSSAAQVERHHRPVDVPRLHPADDAGAAAERDRHRVGVRAPGQPPLHVGLLARERHHVGRLGELAAKAAHHVAVGLAEGVRRARVGIDGAIETRRRVDPRRDGDPGPRAPPAAPPRPRRSPRCARMPFAASTTSSCGGCWSSYPQPQCLRRRSAIGLTLSRRPQCEPCGHCGSDRRPGRPRAVRMGRDARLRRDRLTRRRRPARRDPHADPGRDRRRAGRGEVRGVLRGGREQRGRGGRHRRPVASTLTIRRSGDGPALELEDYGSDFTVESGGRAAPGCEHRATSRAMAATGSGPPGTWMPPSPPWCSASRVTRRVLRPGPRHRGVHRRARARDPRDRRSGRASPSATAASRLSGQRPPAAAPPSPRRCPRRSPPCPRTEARKPPSSE